MIETLLCLKRSLAWGRRCLNGLATAEVLFSRRTTLRLIRPLDCGVSGATDAEVLSDVKVSAPCLNKEVEETAQKGLQPLLLQTGVESRKKAHQCLTKRCGEENAVRLRKQHASLKASLAM